MDRYLLYSKYQTIGECVREIEFEVNKNQARLYSAATGPHQLNLNRLIVEREIGRFPVKQKKTYMHCQADKCEVVVVKEIYIYSVIVKQRPTCGSEMRTCPSKDSYVVATTAGGDGAPGFRTSGPGPCSRRACRGWRQLRLCRSCPLTSLYLYMGTSPTRPPSPKDYTVALCLGIS